jgi:hypothetical protein
MRAIEAQLAGSARVIQTAFGPVAYATGGQGAPVLAIHGAGGGHDQGALWRAPSCPRASLDRALALRLSRLGACRRMPRPPRRPMPLPNCWTASGSTG